MPLVNLFITDPKKKRRVITQADLDELEEKTLISAHLAASLQNTELACTKLFTSICTIVLDLLTPHGCIETILRALLEELLHTTAATQTWWVKIMYHEGILHGVYMDTVGNREHDLPLYTNVNIEAILPTYLPHLLEGKTVVIQLDNHNTPDKAFFAMWELRTVTLVPIMDGRKLWGGIGLVNHDQKQNWTDTEKRYLQLIGRILSKHVHVTNIHQDNQQRMEIMTKLSSIVSIYSWRKDPKGAYTYIDPNWGKLFYPKLYDNTTLLGETDISAINKFRAIQGNTHSFGELCTGTDVVSQERKKLCHYLELGKINGRYLFLHVIKLPEYDDQGNYLGIFGIGHDISFIDHPRIQQLIVKLLLEKSLVPIQVQDEPYIHVYEFTNSYKAIYQLWGWYTHQSWS